MSINLDSFSVIYQRNVSAHHFSREHLCVKTDDIVSFSVQVV